jgi:hypothetical protein
MPRIYSLTSGFLNRAWSDAPDTESAAPTTTARRTRGSLIRMTISLKAEGISGKEEGEKAESRVLIKPQGEI